MSTTFSQHRHLGAPWPLLLLLLATFVVGTALTPRAAHAETPCGDVLHRIAVGSPVGVDDAAVLTAQAFEADVDGFALASWDVADDVTLTAIEATTTEGDVLLLPTTETGTVERVTELRFCGTRDAAATDGDAGAATVTSELRAEDAEVLGVQLLASPERAAAAEAGADRARIVEIALAVGALLAIGLGTARTRRAAGLGGRP